MNGGNGNICPLNDSNICLIMLRENLVNIFCSVLNWAISRLPIFMDKANFKIKLLLQDYYYFLPRNKLMQCSPTFLLS